MSLSVVKSEQSGARKEPKTIRPFKKVDGSLQHEVNTEMDLLLKEMHKVMELEGAKGHVTTPAPVESLIEDEVGLHSLRPQHTIQLGLADANDQHQQKPETLNGHPKKFKCDLQDCGRAFAQKAQKVSHMNSHNGIKKYVRLVADAPLTTNSDGMLTSGQRCDECGVCVSQAGNLQVSLEPKHAFLSPEGDSKTKHSTPT